MLVIGLDKDILPLLICLYCDREDEDLELFIFKDQGKEIIDGLLYCQRCHRYYMVHDTIAYLTKDADRLKKDERHFLKRYSSELPEYVKKNLKPSWGLQQEDDRLMKSR